jgi:hypothetical protein
LRIRRFGKHLKSTEIITTQSTKSTDKATQSILTTLMITTHATTTKIRYCYSIGVLLASLRSTYAWCRVNTFFRPFQIVSLHLAFPLCDNFLLPWDQPTLFSLQNQSVGCRLRHLDPSWSPSTLHSRSRVHRICTSEADQVVYELHTHATQAGWTMRCPALTSKELKSPLFAPEYTRRNFARMHA